MSETEAIRRLKAGEARAGLERSGAEPGRLRRDPAEAAAGSEGGPAQGQQDAARLERTQTEESRTRQALLYILEDVEENRRRIEQAHREWLQSVDALRDPVLVHDAEFRVLRCNRAYAERAGLEFRDIIGRLYWECFPKREGPLPGCSAAACYSHPGAREATQGEEITLDTGESFVSRAFPILDPSGRRAQELHIFEDVTAHKRAQAALARSERHYRKLIEGGSDAFFVIDRAGTLVYRSESGKRLTGWETEDVLGKPITTYVARESVPLAQAAIADVIRNPATLARVELRLMRKDGSHVDIEAIGKNLLADPDVAGIVVTAHDITERKRTEEELKRLNWALRALGESNSALVHAGTEKDLFQACCDAIAGTEGYPLAWVGLAKDDAAHSVEVVAAAGELIRYVDDLEVSWGDTPHGRGPTGTAIRTGLTQAINNYAESTQFSPWMQRAHAHGLKGSISLPICVNGAGIGALTIYSREADAFGQPEVDLFDELAADIGYGVTSRRTLTERDSLLHDQLLGAERLKDALIGTIGAVALTVEKRDPYTAGHQQRVAALCMAIGRKLDFSEDRLEGLRLGATIHDIGKVSVPAEILNRPGKLSAPEFEIIKSHPQVGYDIVKDVKFPWPVTDMILQHHERLGGSGYPNGLKGDAIILEARILAVADVMEAMSSHRPYRPGLGIDTALQEIIQQRDKLYDPDVVDACVRLFRVEGFVFAAQGAGNRRSLT